MRRRVELRGVVAVVDQDHEAACEPARGVAHPFHRAKIDLGAPARFERHIKTIEIRLQLGRRRRSFDQVQGDLFRVAIGLASVVDPATLKGSPYIILKGSPYIILKGSPYITLKGSPYIDVYLAQPIVSHHDLMRRQRVEELVRDQR